MSRSKSFQHGPMARAGVGVGDRFRVRAKDMVSVRAKGWLGFKYYGPKLIE